MTEEPDSEDEPGHGNDGEGIDEEKRQKLREERKKKRMRGKSKSMKRYLRKQRKNVIDPATVCSPSSSHLSCTLIIILGRDKSQIREDERGEEKGGVGEEGNRGEKETIGFGSVQAENIRYHVHDWFFVSCDTPGLVHDRWNSRIYADAWFLSGAYVFTYASHQRMI